jgi:hypothetical protein
VPGSEWFTLFSAALGGGFTVKLIDVVYSEYQLWRVRKDNDDKLTDKSLEPLLRSADELVGKLRSLAEQDFLPIRGIESDGLNDPGFASVVYLFVQFWSEFEIVRQRGLSSEVARSKRGRVTQSFLRCLESRRLRIIDRISQRAIGETALIGARTMNFVEFVNHYDTQSYAKRWLKPLIDVLSRSDESGVRQHILQYTVVLHALIDTLDSAHHVTRARPGTPNKLSAKSWKDLNYRVFDIYLPTVRDRQKYIGPPKRRP